MQEQLSFVRQLEAQTFLFCGHYLNPVHFQANMPEDKDKIVAGLERFLAEHTPEEIEQMVNRREMRSL